jgi:hypothetical protein
MLKCYSDNFHALARTIFLENSRYPGNILEADLRASLKSCWGGFHIGCHLRAWTVVNLGIEKHRISRPSKTISMQNVILEWPGQEGTPYTSICTAVGHPRE